MSRAVFVDRDGTLIVEKNYLADPAGVVFTPGAPEAVRDLGRAGFKVIVVSNQAGVARGLFGEDVVRAIHDHIQGLLAPYGAAVDGYYYCPHHPDFGGPCRCRKPRAGMLLDAERDFGIELPRSFMVGDRLTDLEAGTRVGASGILVRTGYGREEESAIREPLPAAVCDTLADATRWILGRQEGAEAG